MHLKLKDAVKQVILASISFAFLSVSNSFWNNTDMFLTIKVQTIDETEKYLLVHFLQSAENAKIW